MGELLPSATADLRQTKKNIETDFTTEHTEDTEKNFNLLQRTFKVELLSQRTQRTRLSQWLQTK